MHIGMLSRSPRNTKLQNFCPNAAFPPYILSSWSSRNGNLSKTQNLVSIYYFSVLHTRTLHFLSPPSCELCLRPVFNRRTSGHNPRKYAVVNDLFLPPVINASHCNCSSSSCSSSCSSSFPPPPPPSSSSPPPPPPHLPPLIMQMVNLQFI